MKNKKILLIGVIILIIFVIILIERPFSTIQQGNNQNSGLQLGDIAPDFVLEDSIGKEVRLSDYRGKKGVILNFWASWCPACVNEMPIFEEASKTYSNQIVVLGVNREESREKALEFSKSIGVSFPLLLDKNREVNDLYLVLGLPVTYYIDKEGKIVYFKKGELSKTEIYDNIKKII